MKKTKYILWLFLLGFCVSSWSQETLLIGKVIGNSEVENIHVINKTLNRFTTTNSVGAFQITAKLQDTIQITSIKYKSKLVVVSAKNLEAKRITIYLEEHINVLDEVIVGKVLTGDLNSDIQNSEAEKPVDFYDIGIPGYTGPKKTQSERRLVEATTGSGIIPLNPIINAISGRTKMLKNRISLERKDNLMRSIKDRLSGEFFENNELHEDYRMDFLYFCSEDIDFEKRCKKKSDIEIIIFLQEKLEMYQQNLTESKD